MQVKGGVLLSQGIQLPESLEGGGRGMSKRIGSSLQRRQREWPIHLFRAIMYNIHMVSTQLHTSSWNHCSLCYVILDPTYL